MKKYLLLFLITAIFYEPAAAQEYKTAYYSYIPLSKQRDIITDIQVPETLRYDKAKTKTFNYNMKNKISRGKGTYPAYLKITNNLINEDMINELLPKSYYTRDYPADDNSPLNKFRMGASVMSSDHKNMRIGDKTSNIFLNFLLGRATRNIIAINLTRLGENDITNGIELTISPNKQFSLKYSYLNALDIRHQSFEFKTRSKYFNNLALKTTVISDRYDKRTNNITSLEMQIVF